MAGTDNPRQEPPTHLVSAAGSRLYPMPSVLYGKFYGAIAAELEMEKLDLFTDLQFMVCQEEIKVKK